jgi:hypothetical protein
MKTKLFLLLPLFALLSSFTFAKNSVNAVVRANRVYILQDETPVKELVVRIQDLCGKTVYEYTFCNEDTQWFLDLPVLPAGTYSITGNGKEMGSFKRAYREEMEEMEEI